MKIETIDIERLKEYPNNAKIHTPEQIEQIARSIEEFGNNDPIAVDENDQIIEGHGRLLALKKLGRTTAQVIRLTHLTDEQKRAYILVHNKLTMSTGFDLDLLAGELAELPAFDMEAFGFELDLDLQLKTGDEDADWFQTRERNDKSTEGESDEYKEFVEKFEPKKTTDDCYTPEPVYEGVAAWVSEEYHLDRATFCRPFYPGGDYQAEDYTGRVVVDNPPFSILSEILRFYHERRVRFFLFAPTLTLFSAAQAETCTALPVGGGIVYENGADVATSFLTNLEPADVQVRTVPELYRIIKAANEQANPRAAQRKYEYPDELVTAAAAARLCKYGQALVFRKSETQRTGALDAQREMGDAIYGGGYLVSERVAAERVAAERAAAERAAAERAAAERAAAERWPLSEAEREIVKKLGDGGGNNDEEA